MRQQEKEEIIARYFRMWTERDFSDIRTIFSSDIYYSECYGPEYKGLHEIDKWIEDMLQKQQVLQWHIKRFIHQGETVVAEWFFQDRHNNATNGFDGVSIIEFQSDGKICSVKEFESKAEHVTPYR